MTRISFTVDLEDPTERYAPYGSYVSMTQRVLDFCDELKCQATFFTVGKLARAAPHLITDIISRGHEVAYHSHAHTSLTAEDPSQFNRDVAADKTYFEQLTGKPLLGFRAPCFSLTPKTMWAIDVLQRCGFLYSSSIMPTSISMFGFPKAPQTPFFWQEGLLELPLPVAKVGPLSIPYLGGIYLYASPDRFTKWVLEKTSSETTAWTYTHPYDFDVQSAFTPMANTPTWISFILWLARKRTEPKLRQILTNNTAPTLGAQAQRLSREKLPYFSV